MKNKIALLIIGFLSIEANATTTLSGTGVTKPYISTGASTVTTGSLALLIVDVEANGFIGMNNSVTTSGLVLNATYDPSINILNAGSTVGSTFGGDYIAAVTTSGGTGINAALSIPNISTLYGKNWAIVFFDTATITSSSKYGIVRGSDWTLPSSDIAGNITFSNTDASGAGSFYQITASNPTLSQIQSGFVTEAPSTTRASTIFAIVPEPSVVLLGALGALGLLRRRRN